MFLLPNLLEIDPPILNPFEDALIRLVVRIEPNVGAENRRGNGIIRCRPPEAGGELDRVLLEQTKGLELVLQKLDEGRVLIFLVGPCS
ncbi:hypothetical protein CKO41_08360 [Thiococcus pfennigii]|nr:hypothetical protein [Thiococcus pfennigii]MBK1731802.1 hypothetical protein [Thiococcus pfennigii]